MGAIFSPSLICVVEFVSQTAFARKACVFYSHSQVKITKASLSKAKEKPRTIKLASLVRKFSIVHLRKVMNSCMCPQVPPPPLHLTKTSITSQRMKYLPDTHPWHHGAHSALAQEVKGVTYKRVPSRGNCCRSPPFVLSVMKSAAFRLAGAFHLIKTYLQNNEICE